MAVQWQNFKTLIRDSRKILIASHAKLDGDALGSELALAAALRSLGFFVTVVNPDLPAEMFRFIGKDFEEIRFFDGTKSRESESEVDSRKLLPEEAFEYDTLISVDTSARGQLRSISELIDSGRMKVIVIDHHAVRESLTEHDFSDSSKPAAGCLVMELIENLGVPLTLRENGSSCSIADFLFFAIATDTGWFRFPSVLPETFAQAARLTEVGASTSRLYRFAYENYSPARLKLLGVLAKNSVHDFGGRLACSWLEKSDFEQCGAVMGDTADLVNALLMTAGVEAAVLFTEVPGGFRLNLRSRGELNVGRIAGFFGGGGHKNAAGATVAGRLEEVRRNVLEQFKNEIPEF